LSTANRVTEGSRLAAVDADGLNYLKYTGAALDPGVGDFAIGCCFYLNALPVGKNVTLMCAGVIANNSDFYWLCVRSDGLMLFYFCDGDGNYTNKFIGSSAAVAGQWNRVIVENDRDGLVYTTHNGTTTTDPTFAQASDCAPGTLWIGRDNENLHPLDGRICGAFYANRLLTTDERAWVDNSGAWRAWHEFGQAGTDGASLDNSVVLAYYGFDVASALGTDFANSNDMAATGTPVQMDGIGDGTGYVVSFSDASGTGNSLTSAFPRPPITANSVNGQPSVDFSGVQKLTKEFSASVDQGYTVALVGKITAAGVLMDAYSAGDCKLSRNANSRYELDCGTALGGTSVDDGWHVFLLCGNGDGSIVSVDGNEQNGPAGAGALDGLTLGSDKSGANALTGSIAAVAVWDRVLNPAERKLVGRSLASQYGLGHGFMKAVVTGTATKFWVRVPWDASNDYLTGMDLYYSNDSEDQYELDTVTFRVAGLEPTTTADDSLPAAPTTTIHNEGDDIAPVYINNTYIDGNHGAYFVVAATASGHGKDATDLGSEWTDGDPKKWYIVRVVDEDTLWMLSINASATVWSFDTSINGNLTHSSGAAHTDGITVGGQAVAQFYPAITHSTRKIVINGSDVTSDGTYLCDYVDVIDEHVIKDIDAQLDAAIAGVGAQVDLQDASIDDMATVRVTYRFQPTGSVTVDYTYTATKTVTPSYFGGMQSLKMTVPASGTIYRYMPKVAAFTPVATEYNFAAIVDITSLAENVAVADTNWLASNDPPDRFVQFTKTSGSALYSGIAIGYDTTRDNGVPATRAALTEVAWTIPTTGKQYPRFLDYANTPSVVAGSEYHVICYRCPLNFAKYPTPTSVAVYQVYGEWFIAVDWHANYDSTLIVPSYLTGKSVSVVDKHDNVTVNSTTVVDAGIAFTVINDYGYVVVKIS
jgi:hypothetical protein